MTDKQSYPWREVAQIWEQWFDKTISMTERDQTLDWYRKRLHQMREHSSVQVREKSIPSISEQEMLEMAAKWTGTVTKIVPRSDQSWVDKITDDFLKED